MQHSSKQNITSSSLCIHIMHCLVKKFLPCAVQQRFLPTHNTMILPSFDCMHQYKFHTLEPHINQSFKHCYLNTGIKSISFIPKCYSQQIHDFSFDCEEAVYDAVYFLYNPMQWAVPGNHDYRYSIPLDCPLGIIKQGSHSRCIT